MPTAKNIEDGFKALGGGIRDFYSRNKTHIFTALSIGGTVATCVSSAKSGAKIARKIDEQEEELGRHLTGKEKVKLCWKDMMLPAAFCVGSTICSFNTDRVATQMIARSNAALLVSEKAYEELSRKTKEVLGEKKAKQIKDEIAKEEVQNAVAPNGHRLLTKSAFDGAPQTGNGTLTPFIDGYSKLPFWSNIDYIDKVVMKLQEHMREIAPRGGELDYDDKMVGVPYREWLSYIGYSGKTIDSPERRNKGWNKGFQADGSGDDAIEYYRTTEEFEPGFAVTVINWETDPTDMKLGRLIKGAGL